MSVFSYNGVTLPYAYATRFDEKAVYEGPDYYLTNFDINIQAIITSTYMSVLASELVSGGTPVTENPADIMAVVRKKLLTPRKQLSYTVNGTELIPRISSLAGTVDSMNGPQPQSCPIIQLTSDSFLINFHIIANYWENNTTQTAGTPFTSNLVTGNPVLFNRWTESVEIDNCNYSTRTREGKFMIRSDNSQGKIADEVRTQMAAVSIPKGFIRKVARYTQSPDGLAIQYSLTDQEVFKMPPEPAFEATGRYTETTSKQSAVRYGDVSVSLKGSKSTVQARLVEVAIGVAAGKLGLAGASLTDKKTIVLGATCTVGLYENTVDVNVKVQFPSTKQRRNGIAFLSKKMCFTPGSDDVNYTPKYLDRGSAGFLLQAAAYYDPSLKAQLGPGVNAVASPQTPVGAGKVQMTQGVIPGKGGQGE